MDKDWSNGPFPADGYFIVKGLLGPSVGGDFRPVYVNAEAFTWGFSESDDPESLDLDSDITRENVMWKQSASQ